MIRLVPDDRVNPHPAVARAMKAWLGRLGEA
jgi:hypothetical protein